MQTESSLPSPQQPDTGQNIRQTHTVHGLTRKPRSSKWPLGFRIPT